MAEPTIPWPVIWPHLQPLLVAVAATCRQRRTSNLLLTLCVGLLQALGRHTLSQVLVGLGRGEGDWSAAYRLFSQARLDLAAGQRAVLARLLTLLPAEQPFVVVLDGTQLSRTSRRFVGVGWRGRLVQRDPSFWLVSAVNGENGEWVSPLPVAELLSWAWQRWEVEVMHRELKSGFGLGEQQAWSPVAAVLVIQWVVWVYACLVLAGFLAWGWEQRGGGPRWWRGRRWTARSVAQQVRRELWDLEAVTFSPVWIRIPPTPTEMTAPSLPVTTPALLARRI